MASWCSPVPCASMWVFGLWGRIPRHAGGDPHRKTSRSALALVYFLCKRPSSRWHRSPGQGWLISPGPHPPPPPVADQASCGGPLELATESRGAMHVLTGGRREHREATVTSGTPSPRSLLQEALGRRLGADAPQQLVIATGSAFVSSATKKSESSTFSYWVWSGGQPGGNRARVARLLDLLSQTSA